MVKPLDETSATLARARKAREAVGKKTAWSHVRVVSRFSGAASRQFETATLPARASFEIRCMLA
jgi:hypothetical protein